MGHKLTPDLQASRCSLEMIGFALPHLVRDLLDFLLYAQALPAIGHAR
ncbi:MAG: hypothetical protein OXG70_05385 [Cyanobacteria bacterium MAG IRC1_bin_28]|nr:hypothetical protein [Cyanobacteria bacterium MAG IRC1_bin_28]